MGIGTSMGAFHETEFDLHVGDMNEISPDQLMKDRAIASDPKNIYNDQGQIVDYDLPKLPTMDYFKDNEFKKLEPQSMNEASVVPVDYKTKTGVTITDEDIDKGIGLGMAFSGGGLSTIRKGPQMRNPANDNVKDLYNPREPGMIGNKDLDNAIDKFWKSFPERQARNDKRIGDIAEESFNILSKKPSERSEFEAFKLNKLQKERQQLLDQNPFEME